MWTAKYVSAIYKQPNIGKIMLDMINDTSFISYLILSFLVFFYIKPSIYYWGYETDRSFLSFKIILFERIKKSMIKNCKVP